MVTKASCDIASAREDAENNREALARYDRKQRR
jgi:hypothetical protein